MPRTVPRAGLADRAESAAALSRRAPRRAAPASEPRWRLPSLTGFLVRLLVVFFLGTVGWRLVLLAIETQELSRFTRPPVAALAKPRPPVTDEGLAALLLQSGMPGGVVGVYVRNLADGASASQNADRRFPAASLFKLPIMVEVFRQQRLRNFAWDDELTIGREHWTDGSGVLQARVGERVKIRELLRLSIVESDNIAANMLTDLVGVANINQTMEALGLRQTRMVDRFRENAMPTTSPEDMGRLFETLATGRLVDAQTSEEAIRLLESRQAQAWLAEGLPWWGKLAHKWGDLPNARHDVGIIYTPRNQIVIAVLTENGQPAQAANQIKSISRRIVDYVEGPGH